MSSNSLVDCIRFVLICEYKVMFTIILFIGMTHGVGCGSPEQGSISPDFQFEIGWFSWWVSVSFRVRVPSTNGWV